MASITTPIVNPNGSVTLAGTPPNGSNKSRLHIKKLLSNGVEINVFGDDPHTTFDLIISVIALCEGYQLPPSPAVSTAHQDRVNHEESARNTINCHSQAQPGNPGDQWGPRVPVIVGSERTCQVCGSNNLKLINWTDKKTGKPVSKWRCQEQECMAWQKNL